MHEHRECDANSDGRHEDGKEDDGPQKPLSPYSRCQKHGEQQTKDGFGGRRRDRIDQRVHRALDQERLTQELPVVLQADELCREQVPPRQTEPERRDCRRQEQHRKHDGSRQHEPVGIGGFLRHHVSSPMQTPPGPGRPDGVRLAGGYQFGRPSCLACFSTS